MLLFLVLIDAELHNWRFESVYVVLGVKFGYLWKFLCSNIAGDIWMSIEKHKYGNCVYVREIKSYGLKTYAASANGRYCYRRIWLASGD